MSESIHRQLGEISATQRAFHEALNQIRDAIEKDADDRRRSDRERRENAGRLASRIDHLERRTAMQHEANLASLRAMASDLASMKEPVAQLITIRNRMGRILLFAASAIGFIWTLAEPIYTHIILRFLGGGGQH